MVVKLAGLEGSGGLLLIRSGAVESFSGGGGLIISGLGVPGCDPDSNLNSKIQDDVVR